MLVPSEDGFERLAGEGNLVALAREIHADYDTPLTFFRKLDDGRTAFLFESVEGGEEASWPSPGLLTQVPLDGLEVGRDEVGAVGDYPVPAALEAELEVVIELLD